MSSSPTANFHPDGTLFIVSGPSGAGKTTIIRRVKDELEPLGLELHFSVSHTTRVRRPIEKDGVDYHYVERVQFEEMVGRGEFIEWATVHGQMYGTSTKEVRTRLDRGEDVILDIDVQGAEQIARDPSLEPKSVSIFLSPPSFEELEQRLRARGLNSEEEIDLRLNKALDEIEKGFNFYHTIIINDDLEVACACLKAVVLAKKLKSRSALGALREMAQRFKEERSGKITRGN